MIRNLFGVTVFLATISIASFGQNILSRDDLVHWAHNVQKYGPAQAQIAWQKTDEALAQLAPQAGQEILLTCTYDDFAWVKKVYAA